MVTKSKNFYKNKQLSEFSERDLGNSIPLNTHSFPVDRAAIIQ